MADAPDQGQTGSRKHLLDTAARIMRDNDTIDVSLAELSRRSGLNSALVKYYFGNKAGLMNAVVEREMGLALRELHDLRDSSLDPETRLRRHVGRVIDKFFAVPYIQRLLMRLMEEASAQEAQRLADRYLLPVYDAYERFLAEGEAAGVFRPVDARLFFFTLTGAVDRFFAARLFMRYCYGEDTLSEELRDRFRDHTVEFVLAGLKR